MEDNLERSVDTISEPSLAQQRLLDILSYIEKVEKLNQEAFLTINQHKTGFCEFQDKLRGLPGVHLNVASESDDEVWLKVERLLTTPCPSAEPPLSDWLITYEEPSKEPTLKETIVVKIAYKDSLEFKSKTEPVELEGRSPVDPDSLVDEVRILADFPEINELFAEYRQGAWKSWSMTELPRRRTMELYGRLFELHRTIELEGSVRPLEVVWGIGMALWETNNQTIQYPLITQLVELAFHEQDNSILIRPRETDPQLESSAFFALDIPGASLLAERGKLWAKERAYGLSPFVRESFEELLRAAVAHLDKSGRYWPDFRDSDDDRHLPSVASNLVVTDTWAIFARPRTSNFLLQDLTKLKDAVQEADEIGGGPLAIVSDPTDEIPEHKSKSFRGLCGVSNTVTSSGSGASSAAPGELFFPKPYNREQLCIVDLLEEGEGVVVQGPPGTGKTHTITNIICHYLAHGKRVLVTSKAEPALGVIRDYIPEGIRSLVVSILTNEKEGIKQIQNSVEQIGSQVTSASSEALRFQINESKSRLDALHEKIVSWDSEIASIAKQHLSPLPFGEGHTMPAELAEELMKSVVQYEWFPDELGTEEKYICKITQSQLDELAAARLSVGKYLCYLHANLPAADSLPDSEGLIEIHSNLVELSTVSEKASNPRLAKLKNTNLGTIHKAEDLLELVRELKGKLTDFEKAEKPWVRTLHSRLRTKRADPVVQQLITLGNEIEESSNIRLTLIADAVQVPDDAELSEVLRSAIERAAGGERAFGLLDFSNKDAKNAYKQIKLNGSVPQSADGWSRVLKYVQYVCKARELINKWNGLQIEIEGESVNFNKETFAQDLAKIGKLIHLARALTIDDEDKLRAACEEIFTKAPIEGTYYCETKSAEQIENLLELYLPQHKLKAFEGITGDLLSKIADKNGPIVEEMKEILTNRLGKSEQSTDDLKKDWAHCLKELRTIESLRPRFSLIDQNSEAIQNNGALNWGEKLRSSPAIDADEWIPVDALKAWDWRYKHTYLRNIDQREKLKLLTESKISAEAELARTYQEHIKNLSWLRLKENLSNRRRSALQAYLTALKNLGKGKGKSVRGDRFREDARNAMKDAYAAVPCWIMPHWRVSEALPPEIGLFDLVIIDEASQSDIWALPALLRGKKLLVVGDDEQISPTTFAREEDILRLRDQHLSSLPHNFQAQVLPGKSIYDLARVVFPQSHLTLVEHFRCVAPIIEFSNQLCYNGKVQCLRVPKASERIDPPLVDVFVKGGYRDERSKMNRPEAKAIVNEIEAIVKNSRFAGRTIGVVSLLGSEQAHLINEMVLDRLGGEVVQEFNILCGDSMTFQGNERDIMFLSMVATADNAVAQTKREMRQRFNVACSRARDRMYLYRSVRREDLSDKDLRAQLIEHFDTPLGNRNPAAESAREQCQSSFEFAVYDALIEAGYHVIPQVESSGYFIDMVVEGDNDRRLAIECDGDQYHGPEKWSDDFGRQRVLERAGWRFWRCWGSSFYLAPDLCMQDLFETLQSLGITPQTKGKYIRPGLVERREVDPNQIVEASQPEPESAGTATEPTSDTSNESHAVLPNVQEKENRSQAQPIAELQSVDEQQLLGGRDGQVDVGELVEYCFVEAPSKIHTFKLTELGSSDFAQGRVNVTDSLGAILLGLRVNDEVGIETGQGLKLIRIINIHDIPQGVNYDGLDDVDEDSLDQEAISSGEPKHVFNSSPDDKLLQVKPYTNWPARSLPDPRSSKPREILDGIIEIVKAEAPILCDRLYSLYCVSAGLGRMGNEIRSALDKAMISGLNKGAILSENEFRTRNRLKNVIRMPNQKDDLPRELGTRSFEELAPSEIAVAMHLIYQSNPGISVEELYRQTLRLYGFRRMTGGARSVLSLCYRNFFEKMLAPKEQIVSNEVAAPQAMLNSLVEQSA